MKKIKTALKVVLCSVLMMGFHTSYLFAQKKINTITTGVPFLMISPDSKGGAMGDLGVATSPDAASMFWNPAKYAFVKTDMGILVGYSPWLRNVTEDIGLASLFAYKRLDDLQVVAASLRYFSLGQVEFTNNMGDPEGKFHPNEFAIDLAYSRKLSDQFSLAVAGRYIHSNLTLGQMVEGQETRSGNSFAADIALYYEKEVRIDDMDGVFSFGTNISNIGSKISYSSEIRKDFIPTNLRFGPALKLNFDDYNAMTFALDVNKLLVPTYPERDSEDPDIILRGMENNVSVITGMFQSFYDAPNGFSEELREFAFSLGTEYWYDNTFALRAGYFYEDVNKGGRNYFTIGAGLKYNVASIDVSYLIPSGRRNPLDNTLRFTIFFDL